jgi:hypothetical protein
MLVAMRFFFDAQRIASNADLLGSGGGRRALERWLHFALVLRPE